MLPRFAKTICAVTLTALTLTVPASAQDRDIRSEHHGPDRVVVLPPALPIAGLDDVRPGPPPLPFAMPQFHIPGFDMADLMAQRRLLLDGEILIMPTRPDCIPLGGYAFAAPRVVRPNAGHLFTQELARSLLENMGMEHRIDLDTVFERHVPYTYHAPSMPSGWLCPR